MGNMDIDNKVLKVKNVVNERLLFKDTFKPVVKVGNIIKLVQELFPREKDKDFNIIVQESYIQLLIDKRVSPIKARQSWVVASGGNFEGYLRNHINEVLNPYGIIAIKGDKLKKLAKRSKKIKEIVKFLTLPAKRKCTQQSVDVWPDNDILVLATIDKITWRIIASISAKTSSHSRNTSVLFWAIVVRELGVKYFLATQDRDEQFIKKCTSNKVNQERKLFEAYCDGVFTSNPNAAYCSQVKSLILRNDGTSELTNELLDLKEAELNSSVAMYVRSHDIEAY